MPVQPQGSRNAELDRLLESLYGSLWKPVENDAPRDCNVRCEAFLFENRSGAKELARQRCSYLSDPQNETTIADRIRDLRGSTNKVPSMVLGGGGRVPQLKQEIELLLNAVEKSAAYGRQLFRASTLLKHLRRISDAELCRPIVTELLNIRAQLSVDRDPLKRFRRAYHEFHAHVELLVAKYDMRASTGMLIAQVGIE